MSSQLLAVDIEVVFDVVPAELESSVNAELEPDTKEDREA